MEKINIKEKSFDSGRWTLTSDTGKKFSFWEKKQDGTPTKAFEQFKKYEMGEGMAVFAEVKENPYKGKDGKDRIAYNIMYFSTDQFGVPAMVNQPKQDNVPVDTLDPVERRFRAIESRLKALEDANQADF